MTDTQLPERLLDVFEVADKLNVCAASVRREAKRGRLRGTKVGAHWRFHPDDVRAYMDNQRTPEHAAYVEELVRNAPPLSPEQIHALTVLFDYTPPSRD